jgi:hypothetical protein
MTQSELWEKRFEPVFQIPLPKAIPPELVFAKPAEHGLRGADALARAVPPEKTVSARADTARWVRHLVDASWIDVARSGEWVGLLGTAFGREALFGGWEANSQFLEVVSTPQLLYVRTRFVEPLAGASTEEKLAAAEKLGNAIFKNAYKNSVFSRKGTADGFLLALWSNPGGFVSLATDGVGVQYSVVKDEGSLGLKGGSPPPDPSKPWFVDGS